jgi:hypothetical protein
VKKLLIILMLLVLPFQFSWATVAVYCQHEQGATAQHFGHHNHQHHGKADQPDHKEKLSQVHNDCGYCHAASPAFFFASLLLTDMPLGSEQVVSHVFSFSSHIPDGPRRPDRHPVG